MFPPNGWDEHWKDEKFQSINKSTLWKKNAARQKNLDGHLLIVYVRPIWILFRAFADISWMSNKLTPHTYEKLYISSRIDMEKPEGLVAPISLANWKVSGITQHPKWEEKTTSMTVETMTWPSLPHDLGFSFAQVSVSNVRLEMLVNVQNLPHPNPSLTTPGYLLVLLSSKCSELLKAKKNEDCSRITQAFILHLQLPKNPSKDPFKKTHTKKNKEKDSKKKPTTNRFFHLCLGNPLLITGFMFCE